MSVKQVEIKNNHSCSLEILNLVLQFVVDVRLEVVLVIVILGRHSLPLFQLGFSSFGVTFLTESFVEFYGFDVDVLILEFRVLDPLGCAGS